jgi:hypothetical protein
MEGSNIYSHRPGNSNRFIRIVGVHKSNHCLIVHETISFTLNQLLPFRIMIFWGINPHTQHNIPQDKNPQYQAVLISNLVTLFLYRKGLNVIDILFAPRLRGLVASF